jgi:predicted nucleic acid-binding protein
MSADPFIDTNVLVYAFEAGGDKADQAEKLLVAGGVVSVQVLNELANVARRKMGMTFGELNEVLDTVRRLCTVVPLTVAAHQQGIRLAERFGLSIFDAMVVASAQLAECPVLYSEDFRNRQKLGSVVVRNPFV